MTFTMKRSAVLDGLGETQRNLLMEMRRVKATIMEDDAPNPAYHRLLDITHKSLLQAYTAGAFELENADEEGMSPMEALAKIEELKQKYAAEVLKGDCDGSA